MFLAESHSFSEFRFIVSGVAHHSLELAVKLLYFSQVPYSSRAHFDEQLTDFKHKHY